MPKISICLFYYYLSLFSKKLNEWVKNYIVSKYYHTAYDYFCIKTEFMTFVLVGNDMY